MTASDRSDQGAFSSGLPVTGEIAGCELRAPDEDGPSGWPAAGGRGKLYNSAFIGYATPSLQ